MDQREHREHRRAPPEFRTLSRRELDLLGLGLMRRMRATYEPGVDRVITPENVFQPARIPGRAELEAFMDHLLMPGSGIEGVEHLDHCLAEIAAGRTVLFMPEHRGNLDVSCFAALLSRSYDRAAEIRDRLVYVAGRKLNESSEVIKMFSEKYTRLVIVPKREFPPDLPNPSPEQAQEREAFKRYASRINRSAFRELGRLKKEGYILVLFPLGGRLKPGADNRPVRETTSYMRGFDTAYLIGMEGNTLPPAEQMEAERPIQAKVVYRVGPPLDTKSFLAAERERCEAARRAGKLPRDADFEQYAVEHIMAMLEHLRLHGNYGPPYGP